MMSGDYDGSGSLTSFSSCEYFSKKLMKNQTRKSCKSPSQWLRNKDKDAWENLNLTWKLSRKSATSAFPFDLANSDGVWKNQIKREERRERFIVWFLHCKLSPSQFSVESQSSFPIDVNSIPHSSEDEIWENSKLKIKERKERKNQESTWFWGARIPNATKQKQSIQSKGFM